MSGECHYCGHEGCEMGCPQTRAAFHVTLPAPKQRIVLDEFGNTDTFDIPADIPCDCPADDYLTVIRIMAEALEALEVELGDTRATLHDVLDHVRWDSIPQQLVDDIDAIFDGNVDDEDDA